MMLKKKSVQLDGKTCDAPLPPLHLKMLELSQQYRETGQYPIDGLRTVLGEPNFGIKVGSDVDIRQRFEADMNEAAGAE